MISTSNLIKNKRADLSVVVFVILVVIVCSFVLYYITLDKNRIEGVLSGYDVVEDMLLEAKEDEYKVSKIVEECIFLEYNKIVKNEKYIDNPTTRQEGVFSDFDFKKIFEVGMKDCVIKSNIKRAFDLNYLDEKVVFSGKDYQAVRDKNKYIFDININFSLEKMGLMSFERIDKVVECDGNNNCVANVVSGLFDFTMEKVDLPSQIYSRECTKYILTSKREFYFGSGGNILDGSFGKIIIERWSEVIEKEKDL